MPTARPARPKRRPTPSPAVPAAERGDVPGWVLITAMTVALVLAVWTVANQQIVEIIRAALGRAQFN